MDALLYWVGRACVGFIALLPLKAVARLGRGAGRLAFLIDRRHRRVAIDNLAAAFPEKSAGEIDALARENFRRIGETYACAIRTAFMNWEELRPHVQCADTSRLFAEPATGWIVAIGHFGNFELFGRFGEARTDLVRASTYRALPNPGLNRLLQQLRDRSGVRFFERRTEARELKSALARDGLLLGLLADQHAGKSGVRVPFFGRECSTSSAPAVFALRYGRPLFTAFCFRTGLAHWRIELGDQILTVTPSGRRSVEEITRDINASFERAIRRDPANWFWVHRRWKPAPSRRRAAGAAAPNV